MHTGNQFLTSQGREACLRQISKHQSSPAQGDSAPSNVSQKRRIIVKRANSAAYDLLNRELYVY